MIEKSAYVGRKSCGCAVAVCTDGGDRRPTQGEVRAPDVEIRLWLVPRGYQADCIVQGDLVVSSCRDYEVSAESEDAHVQIVLDEIESALAALRRRFTVLAH